MVAGGREGSGGRRWEGRERGEGDFLNKTWVLENSKKTLDLVKEKRDTQKKEEKSREGIKRPWPAEDDLIDNRNPSFFLTPGFQPIFGRLSKHAA